MEILEADIEQELIEKLDELKYTLRPGIRDRAAVIGACMRLVARRHSGEGRNPVPD